MASGFIGQIEMSDTSLGGGSNSSTSLSYTAPSSVQYSVVSISESASIAIRQAGGEDATAFLVGFSVSASTASTGTPTDIRTSFTSNDIRLILGPSESVTIQGNVNTFSARSAEYPAIVYAYTGSMSVLEVN